MPGDMFVEDVLSLETSIYAIEQLRHRYVASMEATAIRYAYIHPGLCGIVMIEPAENQKPKPILQAHNPPGQLAFPFRIPLKPLTVEDDKRYPLRSNTLSSPTASPNISPRGLGSRRVIPSLRHGRQGDRFGMKYPPRFSDHRLNRLITLNASPLEGLGWC